RVMNGELHQGDKVKFVNTGKEYVAEETGILELDMVPRKKIETGYVGYIISGIKEAKEVKVGDTITHVNNPCKEAVQGFEDVKPMVFAGIFPVDTDEYEELRTSIEKLQLNDASLVFEPEASAALGFGFRCGFLGMLHMEIIQQRLEREYGINVITTVPNVSYRVYTKTKEGGDEMLIVNNPSEFPDRSNINYVEEPYIKAQIISKDEHVGSIMNLCIDKRGNMKNQVYLSKERVELTFELPLAEIVFDFYDKLKSATKGFASFDYQPMGYRRSDLIKLDILLNHDKVDALSALIHRDNADELGRKMCK
ncbi:MAG: EF-Tu/IF-2/RF-3 family GTPase, partial [Flavobacteriales bacterium]